jgi:hypothetical protein
LRGSESSEWPKASIISGETTNVGNKTLIVCRAHRALLVCDRSIAARFGIRISYNYFDRKSLKSGN